MIFSLNPFIWLEDSAADAPKTSEYAFFKKFKKDAGLSDVKHLRRQDDHVKHLDISDCTTGRSRHCLCHSIVVGKLDLEKSIVMLSLPLDS